MSDIDIHRRSFLKTSLGAAAVAIAPGMLLFDFAHGKTEGAQQQGALGHADRHHAVQARAATIA